MRSLRSRLGQLRPRPAPDDAPTVSWLSTPVVAAASLALFAGTAQFGVTAIAGDVALEFGEVPPEEAEQPIEQVGMALTTLGIGLAIIRLASMGSLVAASVADRLGRRRTVLALATGGLALTAAAAGAWAFWVFVALLALARPMLTGTDAVAAVMVAEETNSADRAKAIALIGGAYAVGSGLISVLRGVLDPLLDFRGILLIALLPLLLVPVAARRIREPARYAATASGSEAEATSQGEDQAASDAHPDPAEAAVLRRRLGSVPAGLRARLVLICVITFGMGLVLGPVWTYLFVYGEGVLQATPLQMSGLVLAAGPLGLLGLVAGRLAADRLGRRGAAAGSMALTAVAGALAYTGDFGMLAVGYLLSITAGGAYTPSGGALDAEVFPTSVRATAAGWLAASGVLGQVVGLAAFGLLAEAFGTFAVAGVVLCLPVALLAGLYAFLPETRGLELEESAPEPT